MGFSNKEDQRQQGYHIGDHGNQVRRDHVALARKALDAAAEAKEKAGKHGIFAEEISQK